MYAVLYQGWQEKQNNEYDLLKSIAILTGSFTNPQAAREMLDSEGSQFSSSDEDFEKTIKMIEEDVENDKKLKHRRHKRKRNLVQGQING